MGTQGNEKGHGARRIHGPMHCHKHGHAACLQPSVSSACAAHASPENQLDDPTLSLHGVRHTPYESM